MQKIIFLLAYLFLHVGSVLFAQSLPVYYKGAIKEKKVALQRNIIQNTIIKNLSLPLSEETEENWADAFWGMEILQYKSPFTDGRVHSAFDSIEKRSAFFQRALLELLYANYDGRFVKQVVLLMNKVTDIKIYAMCAEYIIHHSISQLPQIKPDEKKQQLVKNEKDEAIARQLFNRLRNKNKQPACIFMEDITRKDFFQNQTILFSFQRKNRNYPGIAIVRDSAGNFILDDNGNIFSVPQLARSISNMPGYLTNGNTPQGIFRMYGFAVSKSNFIGPSANIQLTMPFETTPAHFFNDSTITDTVWTEKWYKKLLPGKLKNCDAMLESFYAGMAGRTEIIAHGTTVNPEYYSGQVYYPQTPTMGCLCTKEIWSEADGKRLYSDQEKLVNALQMAGGAHGYCVVIEIDDAQKPVSIEEILPWLKNIGQ